MNTAAMKNVAIIGGLGAMGRFFGHRFKRAGIEVQVLDRPLNSHCLQDYFSVAELILLAVPLKELREVLLTLRPHLSASVILADICSVKVKPMDLMLRFHKGPVVGTHPLFGPEPGNETALKIALTSGRGEEAYNAIFGLMSSIGLRPFPAAAPEHDKSLAYIQGLNFVTSLSYLAAVSQQPGIEKFVTPSFQKRLDASCKMLNQDASLFKDLFETNPYSYEAVRHFRSFLNLAASGDLDLLQDMAKWWWDKEQQGAGP